MTKMAAAGPAPAQTNAHAGDRGFALWRLLAVAAAVLIAVAYFQPAWWVALKAPNYPEQTFPDGIRIHFHVDGVNNGCTARVSTEVIEKETLDCVHEMDTINHFVGMYPIASGGPVEKLFSPFLFAFLTVLAIGFAIPGRALRVGLMALGFGAIAVWMGLALFKTDGANLLSRGYLYAMVTSLGQAEGKENEENISPVIKQLRESLLRSGIEVAGEQKKVTPAGSREELFGALKYAFETDQGNRPADQRHSWNGSAMQLFAWHYDRSLNRWFNEPERNQRLVNIMTTVAWLLFAGVLVAMPVFLLLAYNERRVGFWLLGLAPAIVPFAFLAEYSVWLWWYGHSLNAMGAFTLKPFMPTVLGQGKVAQFTTLSYPTTGFFLLAVAGGLMLVAMVMRRNAQD